MAENPQGDGANEAMKQEAYRRLLQTLDRERCITLKRAREVCGRHFSTATWKRIKKTLKASDGLELHWDRRRRVFTVPATWTLYPPLNADPRKRDQLAVLRAAAARVGPPLIDKISMFIDQLDAQLSKLDPDARATAPVRQPVPRADRNFYDLLNRVEHAVRNHQIITMKYRKTRGGRAEERSIAPYAVHDYAGRFYVWGIDEGDEKAKFFALDRIEDVRVDADDIFTPDPGISIDDELRHSFGIWVGHRPAEDVVVDVSEVRAADVYARRWPAEKSCTLLPDGRLRIVFSVNDPREVVAWVLSLGGEAKVLEPAAAAKLAWELGQKIVTQHKWAADVPTDERVLRFSWGEDGLPIAIRRA